MLQTVPVLQTFRVYVSVADDVQSEWVVADLLKITETARDDKRLCTLKRWLQASEELHKNMWPDRDVPNRRIAKKNRMAVARSNEDPRKLLDERTVPTSIFVLLLVHLSTHGRQPRKQREQALQWLRHLVTTAFVKDEICGQLHVHEGGLANRSVWPADICGKVQALWEGDLLNPDSFWVQSTFDKSHLADVIGFILRPAFKGRADKTTWSEVGPALQEVLHASIRLLTETLHINLNLITVSQGVKRKTKAEQEKAHGCKKKKTLRVHLERTTDLAETIAKLYAGEETW